MSKALGVKPGKGKSVAPAGVGALVPGEKQPRFVGSRFKLLLTAQVRRLCATALCFG